MIVWGKKKEKTQQKNPQKPTSIFIKVWLFGYFYSYFSGDVFKSIFLLRETLIFFVCVCQEIVQTVKNSRDICYSDLLIKFCKAGRVCVCVSTRAGPSPGSGA